VTGGGNPRKSSGRIGRIPFQMVIRNGTVPSGCRKHDAEDRKTRRKEMSCARSRAQHVGDDGHVSCPARDNQSNQFLPSHHQWRDIDLRRSHIRVRKKYLSTAEETFT
jgi:hypothetical protein